MIRTPIATVLCLLATAWGAQTSAPKESAAEEMLRLFLREETSEPDHSLVRRIEEIRKAVIRLGSAAIPGLLAALRNGKATRAERYCAVKAIIDLDPEGKHARDLLVVLEERSLPFTVAHMSDASVGAYLGRFLREEADLRRLVKLLAGDDRDAAFLAQHAFSHVRPDQAKRLAPEVLRTIRNVDVLHVALGSLRVDSEETRAALLVLAHDETKPRHIRLTATEAWAERVGRASFPVWPRPSERSPRRTLSRRTFSRSWAGSIGKPRGGSLTAVSPPSAKAPPKRHATRTTRRPFPSIPIET